MARARTCTAEGTTFYRDFPEGGIYWEFPLSLCVGKACMKGLLFLTISLLLVATPGIAATPGAIEYRPPKTRSPQLEGRSPTQGISPGCPQTLAPPVLLMPAGPISQTTASHPTLFAFLPAATSVQFVVTGKGDSSSLYVENFANPVAGVVRLPIPKTAPALVVGKEYWWYVSVLCDARYGRDRSYLQGWLQRVTPDPRLGQQLDRAPVADRPALYAAAGLWYDALSSLDELRQKFPQEPRFSILWTTLLQSVGLDQVAALPVLNSALSVPSPGKPAPGGVGGNPAGGYRVPDQKLPARNTGGGTR
mgnify:FL=1